MNTELISHIIVYGGAIIAWVTLNNHLASILTKSLNEQAVSRIRSLLLGIREGSFYKNMIVSFDDVIDAVFGRSIFSWKSFLKSACLSILVFCSLTIYALRGYADLLLSESDFQSAALYATCLFLFMNIILDYLSFSKTRYLIRKFEKSNVIIVMLVLVADMLITSNIFFMVFFTVKQLYFQLLVWAQVGVFDIVEVIRGVRAESNQIKFGFMQWLSLSHVPMNLVVTEDFAVPYEWWKVPGYSIQVPAKITYVFPESAAYITTFVTIIWLVLHAASIILARIMNSTLYIMRIPVMYSHIEKEPVYSLAQLSLFIAVLTLLTLGVSSYMTSA